jgi:hypothetical protein
VFYGVLKQVGFGEVIATAKVIKAAIPFAVKVGEIVGRVFGRGFKIAGFKFAVDELLTTDGNKFFFGGRDLGLFRFGGAINPLFSFGHDSKF